MNTRQCYHVDMNFLCRCLASAFLLLVFGFCVFGFIATFEPLPPVQQWVWRTVYGLVGLASIIGVVRPMLSAVTRPR